MAETQTGEKWYQKKSTIVISFFIFPPFALPFIWLSPRYSTIKKIAATVVIVVVTWVCWIWLKDAYQRAMEQYKELKEIMGLA